MRIAIFCRAAMSLLAMAARDRHTDTRASVCSIDRTRRQKVYASDRSRN